MDQLFRSLPSGTSGPLSSSKNSVPTPGTYGGVLLNHPLMADPEAAVRSYAPDRRAGLLQQADWLEQNGAELIRRVRCW